MQTKQKNNTPKRAPSIETFTIDGKDLCGVYLTVRYKDADHYFGIFFVPNLNRLWRWEPDPGSQRWVERSIKDLSQKRLTRLLEFWEEQTKPKRVAHSSDRGNG